MCGSPHMETRGDIHPKERKYGSESLRHMGQSQTNTSGTVPQIKQEQVRVRRGSKTQKLYETVRNSKVSLSEKIPVKQIKNISIWHTKYRRVLVQESPNSFLRQLLGAISRVSNKITILWCKRKHRSNYCRKKNLQQIY